MIIVATLPESSQRILIEEGVLGHMARHRQLSWYSREAGGQLFGSINASEVVVSAAAGPYRGDQRWRSSYRSNADAAQRAINQHAKKGLLYLGEWHTHPEEHPKASPADRDAMACLLRASQARLNNLLMVIQGRADGLGGLALYSFGSDGLVRWTLFVDDNILTIAN
ncbi:Mov34/MPN/PAD-1 family protein [Xanthomonas perforans]